MHLSLLRKFRSIRNKCKDLLIKDLSTSGLWNSTVTAAFAKNIEFNITCNQKSVEKSSFFLLSSLRGLCEDYISLKYLKDKVPTKKDELILKLMAQSVNSSIQAQGNYFKKYKPEQPVLSNLPPKDENIDAEIKRILLENGITLKNGKSFPSVVHMATDSGLIELYKYLYHATSKIVHFEPSVLLRLGWSDNIHSKKFQYSTEHFYKYYRDFNSYYGTYLFIEFYKTFKKELGLESILKNDIKLLEQILNKQFRIPEIVTFEEMNLKPPSFLQQMLYRSAKRLEEESKKTIKNKGFQGKKRKG